MSFARTAARPLLQQGARSAGVSSSLRAGTARPLAQGSSLLRPSALPLSVPSSLGSRALSTHNNSRPQLKARSNKAVLLYAAAAPFSILSWLGLSGGSSESGQAVAAPVDGDVPSKSSTLRFPASPAALRQASSGPEQITLVFLNINRPSPPGLGQSSSPSDYQASKEWRHWIAYFREQGYDCLNVNVVDPSLPAGVSARATHPGREGEVELSASSAQRLAKDLEAQIALQMLPRGAVLFSRGRASEHVSALQASGGDPQFSALVLLLPRGGEEAAKAAEQKLASLWPSKLRKLVLTEEQLGEGQKNQSLGPHAKAVAVKSIESEAAIREAEMWLMGEGF